MKNPIKTPYWLNGTTAGAVGISLTAFFAAYPLGLALVHEGYWRKPNWYLYPGFFVVVGYLASASWSYFEDVWRNLVRNRLLWRDNALETDNGSLEPFIYELTRLRPILFAVSILIGLALTSLDAGCLWKEYLTPGLVYACPRNDVDFSVAYWLPINVNPVANGIFVLVVYLLQGLLIAYALFATFQMILHSASLLLFERLSFARQHHYEIHLNARDPLRQFGLFEVNKALNVVYIFIALGMVAPFLSIELAFENHETMGIGKQLLRICIPLILFVPLAIPIADRAFRYPDIASRVRATQQTSDADELDKQKLWPFDPVTRIGLIGKACFAVAFLEYSYVLHPIPLRDTVMPLLEKIFK